MTAPSGLESKAIGMSMLPAGPPSCANHSGGTWPGTGHIQVHRAEGATPPATPAEGTIVYSGSGGSSWIDFVQRSNKQYSYTVFACANIGTICTVYYADGVRSDESISTASGSDNKDTATTQPEMFELVGITDYSDTNQAVFDHSAVNAPEAFFYPTGFSLEGDLAMYVSVDGDAATDTPSLVFHTAYEGATDADGWPTEVNEPSSWGTPTLVARGPADDTAEDHLASHPWVMFTHVGTQYWIELFLQSQFRTTDNDNIVEVRSSTDVGDDFGLVCTTSCVFNPLDVGDLVIEGSSASTTPFVHDGRHGRLLWDYLANGPVETTDDPAMVFMLERPKTGDCSDSGSYDDIGWADGAWVSGAWSWTVYTEASSPYCPEIQVDDSHDPAIIPLPGGQFKMYYKSYGSSPTWYVAYWDGGPTWEDATPVEFYWDGSSSGPGHGCVENLSAVIKHTPIAGGGKQGVFFRLMDPDDECGDADEGFDDDPDPLADDMAIVFAQLANG